MAFTSPVSPGDSDIRDLRLEREGRLRADHHQYRHRPVVPQPFGEENHGRDPDPAAQQQCPGAAGDGLERPADGSDEAEGIAGAFRGEKPRPAADLLVQDVDPAAGGVGPHQRHRTAHREQRGRSSHEQMIPAWRLRRSAVRGCAVATGGPDAPRARGSRSPRRRWCRDALEFGSSRPPDAGCPRCGPGVYYNQSLPSLADGKFTEEEQPEAEDDFRRASSMHSQPSCGARIRRLRGNGPSMSRSSLDARRCLPCSDPDPRTSTRRVMAPSLERSDTAEASSSRPRSHDWW